VLSLFFGARPNILPLPPVPLADAGYNLAAAAAAAPAGEWGGEEQERRGGEEAVKAGGRAEWEARGFATADTRWLM